jgi:hypothetical protein
MRMKTCINPLLDMLIKEENDSVQLVLFDEENIYGKLFYKKTSTDFSDLKIFLETWVIQCTGNPLSMLRIKNVKDDFYFMRIHRDGHYTFSAVRIHENLTVRFVNTCFWKNEWAWVNVATNTPLITFEMKTNNTKRGLSKIKLPVLPDNKAIFLSMIGWYILHNIDLGEKKNTKQQEMILA